MLDPNLYPSRAFIRFTAHNQLLADLTGETVTASVQRWGGQTYLQTAQPGKALPSLSRQSEAGAAQLTLGMALHPSPNPTPLSQDMAPSLSQADPVAPAIAEDLFTEVTQTLFQACRSPQLYQDCGSPEAAKAVEEEVAAEIIATYRQIKQNQTSPIVQRLNQQL
ncbi:MAG: hypothetical protein KGQ93_10455 [Cyanobacteria bacterium REEB459]|nr:hypothetical protein [Cyanobacteria bacterium REEB459]